NTGTLTINDSTLLNNAAGSGGNGGNGYTNANNAGNGGNGGNGGSIYNTRTLTINNSTLLNNTAGNGGNSGITGTLGIAGNGGNGGAIYSEAILSNGYNIETTITHSTLINNNAGNGGNAGTTGFKGSGGEGGAIYSKGNLGINWPPTTWSDVIVTRSIILNNNPGIKGQSGLDLASNGSTGGIFNYYYGTASVQYNYIFNNGGYAVRKHGTEEVNAEYNWWGSNSNPNSQVSGNVDVFPWLILTITPAPTPNVYYTNNLTVTAEITHINTGGLAPGGPVADGIPVTFTTSWGSLTPFLTTTLNGLASTTYTANGPTPIPTSPVRIYAIANNENNVYTQVNILKMITNVVVDPAHNFAGQNITLKANVTDQNGNPVNEGQVTFIVNGEPGVTVNVVNGIATKSWTIPASWNAGTYPQAIVTNYLGTANYLASIGNNTLIVDKTPTTVIVNPAHNFAGQTVTLRANVTDYYGNPITVGQVTFVVNGEPGVTVNVDSYGIAQTTWSIPASWIAGTYPQAIVANYSGTANYLTSTGNNTLTVDKTPTQLVVSNIIGNKGKNVNLTAILTDYYGAPLSGKTVTFKVDGVAVPGTATTDALGVATISYYNILVGGNYTIKADFAGDGNYLASYGNGILKVPQSSIYVTITPSKNNPKVGETITLTFKLGNNGPDPADNVIFTYVLPDGMELVNISGDPAYSYNVATRTITWNLGNVNLVDPWLYVDIKILKAGSYLINPIVTTDTYDPGLSSNVQSITINAVQPVHAAGKTIPMQPTGIPIGILIVAVLAVLGGLISPRIRK
ncbi:MAG TPA: Ig-like domain repeat protein, partial [Methanobacterium sp.]|nr:Ig-like domain repeat protein [Methanobacterium sp.]